MTSKSNTHTFSDLYYYPGHSYSPLNYLDLDLESFINTTNHIAPGDSRRGRKKDDDTIERIDTSFKVFYALTPDSGEYRLTVVILIYQNDEERVVPLKRDLYPGAIINLPSKIFELSHHRSSLPSKQSTSSSDDESIDTMPRLATLSFTYPSSVSNRNRKPLDEESIQMYESIGRPMKDGDMNGKIGKFREVVEDRVWKMLFELQGQANELE